MLFWKELKAETFDKITIPTWFLISNAIEEEYPPVAPLCQIHLLSDWLEFMMCQPMPISTCLSSFIVFFVNNFNSGFESSK